MEVPVRFQRGLHMKKLSNALCRKQLSRLSIIALSLLFSSLHCSGTYAQITVPQSPTSNTAPKLITYSNGFAIPEGAKVGEKPVDPFDINSVINFAEQGGKVSHLLSSLGVYVPVNGWKGFKVKIAKFNVTIYGEAVIVPDLSGGTVFEYGLFASPNLLVHYTPNAKGFLTYVDGKTEWLLPDFDLNRAAFSKTYVYKGRVIEYKAPVDK